MNKSPFTRDIEISQYTCFTFRLYSQVIYILRYSIFSDHQEDVLIQHLKYHGNRCFTFYCISKIAILKSF